MLVLNSGSLIEHQPMRVVTWVLKGQKVQTSESPHFHPLSELPRGKHAKRWIGSENGAKNALYGDCWLHSLR